MTKKVGLAVKIIGVVAIAIVALYAVQTVIITQNSKKTLTENYEEEVEALTKVYSELISSNISSYTKQLQTYTTADVVKTENNNSIVSWLKAHESIRSKDFDYVAFVDRDGLFSSDINTTTDVKERSYYKDIIQKGLDETMDDPVASKVSGKTIIHVCKAAKANGRTIGFFTGIVTMDTIHKIINNITLGKTGVAVLLDSKGKLIATSGDEAQMRANLENGNATFEAHFKEAVTTGALSSAWINDSTGKKFLTVTTGIENTPWVLTLMVAEEQAHEAANAILKIMIIAGILISIVLTIIIAVSIIRELQPLNVVKDTIAHIASGDADLTRRIDIKKNNEIGEVVDGFNNFSAKLQDIVKNLKNSKELLVETGTDLNHSTREAVASITQILSSIRNMDSEIVSQTNSVTQTAGAVNEIASNIESLNNMIENQAKSVTSASSAIEEMIGNINSVNSSVAKMANSFTALEHQAIDGVQKQEDVNVRISSISTESLALQEANSVISNIAEQTNLLAMNAAIEAAHAGEAGKGFSVVADEIRKLSETSSAQSKSIGIQLKKITDSISGIVEASKSAANAFSTVATGINETNNIVREINSAMQEQSEGSKQISIALNSMNDSTSEVRRASEEMAEGNKAILQEIQLLQDSTINMRQGMSEMSRGAENINSTSSKLSELARHMDNSIGNIGKQIDQFKV